jgi:protein TonB
MNVRAGALARKGRFLFAGALSLCLHAAFFGLGLGLFRSPSGGGTGYVLTVDIADGAAQERADTAGIGADSSVLAHGTDRGQANVSARAAPAEPAPASAALARPAPARAAPTEPAPASVALARPAPVRAAPAKPASAFARNPEAPAKPFVPPPQAPAAATAEAGAFSNKNDALIGEGELGGQSPAAATAGSRGAGGGALGPGSSSPSSGSNGPGGGSGGSGLGAAASQGGVSGAGGGSAAGAGKADSAYFDQIMAQVEKRKIYPEAARLRGTEGTVRIRLSISVEGRLVRAELASSSGSSLLDRAALDLVAAVFPMPNPTGRKLAPIIGVSYSLTR